jgi:PAS domain S-box-containing protein
MAADFPEPKEALKDIRKPSEELEALRARVKELERSQEAHLATERQLEDQLERFHALYDLAVAMTTERSLDENLSLVVETSRRLLDGDTSYIALQDADSGTVYMHTLSGIRTGRFKSLRLPIGMGLGGKVALTGKGLIVEDYFQEIGPIVHDVVREEGLVSGVAVPVRTTAQNLGVLYVFDRKRRQFKRSDLDTLSLLGNLAAVEIRRDHRRTELREAHDELERRVEERTAQLRTANEELSKEIAKRHKAQVALKESERRYRTLFESAADAIYILDAHPARLGKIVSANPAAAEMHGYSLEELLTLAISDLNTPVSASRTYERLGRMSVGETLKREVTHRKKDGTVFPVEINARLLEGEDYKHVLAIDRDITDRKKAEQLLKESEERMRLLIEAAPVGIRITQDGKHCYVNPKFTEMFGYDDPLQILGLPVEALYAPEERQSYRDRVQDRLEGRETASSYELTGLRRNGDRFEVAVRLTPITYEGHPSLLGFLMDISEERRLRAQLLHAQKMEAIGTLAGGLAHDFNNLLQIILGHSELMSPRNDESHPDYRRILEIRAATGRGINLVRRMLAFGRKTETKLRPINLNHHLLQLETVLRRTIPRMIEIRLHLEENLRTIDADASQVEQVLLNLVVNAKHAMPEGGKLVLETRNVRLQEQYCRMHPPLTPGRYVLLMVSDSGHGMNRSVLDRIFEPFFTTKTPGEGTGLGLSMVFGIMRSHGGQVTCYSEPGVGTVFKLYFPAVDTELGATTETIPEMPAFGTETILLVDDEKPIRDLGKELLSEAGYTVLIAGDGAEALKVYGQIKDEISLVILDLIMPGMGGKACFEELKKIDPEVKVLIASGYSAHGPSEDVTQSGAKGFIGKPYNLHQILMAVRKAIDAE